MGGAWWRLCDHVPAVRVSGSATTLFEEKNSGYSSACFPRSGLRTSSGPVYFWDPARLVQSPRFLRGRVFFGLDIFGHLGGLLP